MNYSPQRNMCLFRAYKVCSPETCASVEDLKDMFSSGPDREDHVMQSTDVLHAMAALGPNIILVERLRNGKMNCNKVLYVATGDRWVRGNVKETSLQTYVITYANNHYMGVRGDTISPEEWKLILNAAEAILWPVRREDEELERALMESLQTASREDEELERALMESLLYQ